MNRAARGVEEFRLLVDGYCRCRSIGRCVDGWMDKRTGRYMTIDRDVKEEMQRQKSFKGQNPILQREDELPYQV